MFKPVVLPEVALTRLLRRFAMNLGLSDSFGEVTAQAFLQMDKGTGRWSDWLLSQCGNCKHSPDSCSYLNPPKEMCFPSVTQLEIRSANMLIIETGRLKDCPLIES
jgi:hypothetical protein